MWQRKREKKIRRPAAASASAGAAGKKETQVHRMMKAGANQRPHANNSLVDHIDVNDAQEKQEKRKEKKKREEKRDTHTRTGS